MSDLLSHLNERQREAVTAPLGPVLVLAGAGSGKTRVLTYRIAYLLQEKIFVPDDLLALTFTNKAAGEMRDRILGLIGKSDIPTSDFRLPIVMGTFHSVCARILRKELTKLEMGYDRNFVIYDSDDSQRLIKQIILELGFSDRIRPNVLAYYIGMAKNWLQEPRQLPLDNSFLEGILQKVYGLYQKRLQEHNALDFDDLLRLVCELFSTDRTVKKKYQNQFKYILVDEYQDTNHAQYVILNFLVERHRNLFVVGDDAQSIYGFRGANMQNILDFKKDYPKAQIIMLDQNYRSTQNILDAAAKVIKLNPYQYEKKLWTTNQEGNKINLYEARDEMDEGDFVVKKILGYSQVLVPEPGASPSTASRQEAGLRSGSRSDEELVYETEETPILNQFIKNKSSPPMYGPINRRTTFNSKFEISDLKDTVILYRTHAQSRPFEEILLSAGIPYQIVGGIKFYERKEIKDVLSYLRILINPRDLISLSRVINIPARGIGAINFRILSQVLSKYDYNYGRMLLNLNKLSLQTKVLRGARDFFGLFSSASKIPKQRNVLELMHFLLSRAGYKESLLDGSREALSRWENVEELFNVAARYKHLPWREGLQAFLEEVALMTDLDTMENERNSLTLMTLHAAKGLEFDNVFLVGLEEGLLPHSRSFLSPQELAEEIRLAYVGITRAKRNLYLSYAKMRQTFGEMKKSIPSRIIKAIPKKLIHKLNA